MRFLLVSLFSALSTLGLIACEEKRRMPWMGVILETPKAQLDRPLEMGEGTGLLVEAIIKEGPLGLAGGLKGDLWWKFDDQILVNTRQLLVLLRMKKVGDSVQLNFFRDGKLISKEVILGERPATMVRNREFMPNAVRARDQECETEEAAEMKDGELTYKLTEREGSLNLLISKEDEVVFNGPVSTDEDIEKLEVRWKSSLLILRQALVVHAKPKLENRGPRVRYLPRKAKE
jgi:hypothetical protein